MALVVLLLVLLLLLALAPLLAAALLVAALKELVVVAVWCSWRFLLPRRFGVALLLAAVWWLRVW